MSVRATPLRVFLADDELLARQELSFLLKEVPQIEIVGEADNGLEAVRQIQRLQPDLVFVDVQMPSLDGLGVIRQLREKMDILPWFVLATAYDQYAIDAFRLEAMDYILKPVERERLLVTLDRARRSLEEQESAEPPSEAESHGPRRQKLLIRQQNKFLAVAPEELVAARIQDGLITLTTATAEGEATYRSIEELQGDLDSELFWRPHRSFLVNVRHIREVIPWFNSTWMLRMDDRKQSEVPVSRFQTRRLRELVRL
jgi:two-component system, LytTR family, response regulator LytT